MQSILNDAGASGLLSIVGVIAFGFALIWMDWREDCKRKNMTLNDRRKLRRQKLRRGV